MNKLPNKRDIFKVRNGLLNELASLNIPLEILQAFDLSCFSRDLQGNAYIHIDSYELLFCVPVVGNEQALFNDWITLRSWAKPACPAFFISLRGRSTGQRLTVSAIRAIIKTTAQAEEQREERKSKFSVIDGGKYEFAKKAL